ncbi:hypothetical protein AAMO2058_000612600 [Amorphochlora amoebiformis]
MAGSIRDSRVKMLTTLLVLVLTALVPEVWASSEGLEGDRSRAFYNRHPPTRRFAKIFSRRHKGAEAPPWYRGLRLRGGSNSKVAEGSLGEGYEYGEVDRREQLKMFQRVVAQHDRLIDAILQLNSPPPPPPPPQTPDTPPQRTTLPIESSSHSEKPSQYTVEVKVPASQEKMKENPYNAAIVAIVDRYLREQGYDTSTGKSEETKVRESRPPEEELRRELDELKQELARLKAIQLQELKLEIAKLKAYQSDAASTPTYNRREIESIVNRAVRGVSTSLEPEGARELQRMVQQNLAKKGNQLQRALGALETIERVEEEAMERARGGNVLTRGIADSLEAGQFWIKQMNEKLIEGTRKANDGGRQLSRSLRIAANDLVSKTKELAVEFGEYLATTSANMKPAPSETIHVVAYPLDSSLQKPVPWLRRIISDAESHSLNIERFRKRFAPAYIPEQTKPILPPVEKKVEKKAARLETDKDISLLGQKWVDTGSPESGSSWLQTLRPRSRTLILSAILTAGLCEVLLLTGRLSKHRWVLSELVHRLGRGVRSRLEDLREKISNNSILRRATEDEDSAVEDTDGHTMVMKETDEGAEATQTEYQSYDVLEDHPMRMMGMIHGEQFETHDTRMDHEERAAQMREPESDMNFEPSGMEVATEENDLETDHPFDPRAVETHAEEENHDTNESDYSSVIDEIRMEEERAEKAEMDVVDDMDEPPAPDGESKESRHSTTEADTTEDVQDPQGESEQGYEEANQDPEPQTAEMLQEEDSQQNTAAENTREVRQPEKEMILEENTREGRQPEKEMVLEGGGNSKGEDSEIPEKVYYRKVNLEPVDEPSEGIEDPSEGYTEFSEDIPGRDASRERAGVPPGSRANQRRKRAPGGGTSDVWLAPALSDNQGFGSEALGYI